MEVLYKLLTVFGLFCLDQIVICDSGKDFKSIPTTVKTYENDTVLLPCYLQNAGVGYQVRWLKDGKVIYDAADSDILTPFRIRVHSNHSLQVNRVQQTDTGEYVCEIIRTEPWSPIRQSHAIEVLFPPSVTTIPEIGILEVHLGDEVDIGCKAMGEPHPYISWLNKGQPMELINNRARLKFKASSRHLAGLYECIASNGVGEPARATIQVVIMHPPEVETESQWVHTSPGFRAELQCKVTASPSAKVHWFHGHNPIKYDSRFISQSKDDIHTLVIRTVRIQDLGDYTCKAENRIGMSEVKLQLNGKANIAKFKVDAVKNHPAPTSYTVIWEVDSYSPIIEYRLWFRPYKPRPPQKDGVFIKEKDDTWTQLTIPGESNEGQVHTGVYEFRGLTPSTVYETLVLSKNRFGWSKPSTVLHFATTSIATEQPVATDSINVEMPILEEDSELSSIYPTVLLNENLIPKESSIISSSNKIKSLISIPIILCVLFVQKILFSM